MLTLLGVVWFIFLALVLSFTTGMTVGVGNEALSGTLLVISVFLIVGLSGVGLTMMYEAKYNGCEETQISYHEPHFNDEQKVVVAKTITLHCEEIR